MNHLLPAAALLGPLLTVLSCLAADKSNETAEEPHIYYSMTPGRYALIGQQPNGGAAYSGSAEITYRDGALSLVKSIDGTTISAIGKVTRTSMSETEVLSFNWPGHDSVCLPLFDLDNFIRLSCYWFNDAVEPQRPGLEAYFPTATWPENRER